MSTKLTKLFMSSKDGEKGKTQGKGGKVKVGCGERKKGRNELRDQKGRPTIQEQKDEKKKRTVEGTAMNLREKGLEHEKGRKNAVRAA